MDDQNTQQTGGATSTGATGSAAVVVDKNKSNEDYIKEAELGYIIPNLVREKFPDLIKLIFETESMNVEEREYWLQILPIMGEDQIVKFREILVNEKEQLSKLDQEYQQQTAGLKPESKPIDEEAKRQQFLEIEAKEKEAEAGEQSEEDALLNSLNSL